MRRVSIVILIICLLLTSGCAGNNSGAVSDKVTSVKDITMTSVEQAYVVEEIDFPQELWFSSGNIVTNDGKIYLLGSLSDKCLLYSMDADGTNAKLLASCDDGNEFWYSCCADGDMIYLYDSYNHRLVNYNTVGEKQGYITLPDDIVADKTAAANGKVYTLGNGKLTCLKISGETAEADFALKVSEPASLAVNKDGKIIAAWQNADGQVISMLDEENKRWGAAHSLDADCTIIGTGSEWELYLRIGNALYGYDLDSAVVEKLLTFSDIGMLSNGMICEIGAGSLLYTGASGKEASKPVVIKPVATAGENVTLTLATLGQLHPAIEEAILAWNQRHPDMHVELRDYSSYNTASDLRGGEYKLIADIAAGDGPDIFNLSDFGTTMNASLLARRKLLENLYPFIEQDSELSKDDFLSGPLRSLEINNELCQITPYFLLLTTTAPSSDMGSSENCSYSSLEKIVAESDYYQYLFDNMYTRDDWLEIMVAASGNKLVDWSNAKCHFDSEYFLRLLEIALPRPTETEVTGGSVTDLVQNSHSLLYMQTFRDVWESGMIADIYGADNYTFVGIPEVGNVIVPELSLGMSAQSSHKEQCWQFMREFLLKDSPYTSGIPLRRDGVKQQMMDELEAMKEYPEEHPGRAEAMEDFLVVLENADTLYQSDASLWSIVSEEVNKFYAGRSTAEETAQAVQSRASIYLAEQAV